jgi:hypothetical protein
VSALGFSIVASILLTVLLNVGLRLFPGSGRRINEAFTRLAERTAPEPTDEPGRSNVRVIVPWKAMLIASLVLTIAVNVFLRLFR